MAEGQVAAVLALDGGNSKTDVALIGDDGSLLASVTGPGFTPHTTGFEQEVETLDELVRKAASQAGLGEMPGLIAQRTVACLANADLPEEEEELAAVVRAQAWSLSSTVVNDTYAILRAGSRETPRWGCAVVCGAGINCVAVTPDGQTARYLALGTLSGDWGGGNGLGAEIIYFTMRAEDGRGRDTVLTEIVTSHFDAQRVEDVAIGLHKGTILFNDLGQLCPALFAAAQAGDSVALEIVDHQADEVARMALAAMRRVGLTERATPVVLGGGVLIAKDSVLLDGISRRIAEAAPKAEIRIIEIPPVAGAALLGLDEMHAPASAEARLRAAYDTPPTALPGRLGSDVTRTAPVIS